MGFAWDDASAALNLCKHRVMYEDATRVFLDSGRIALCAASGRRK